MKVLIVNTYDFGGAANSCVRLHLGLLDCDVDSSLLLRTRQNPNIPNSFISSAPKSIQQKNNSNRITRKLKHVFFQKNKDKKEATNGLSHKIDLVLKERSKELEMFSLVKSKFDITESVLYKEADIINLHWVADFLDFESFFAKNTKPLVWTLHDMFPFTGGEHYEENYLGIDTYGKPKLRLVSQEEKEISAEIFSLKQKLFESCKSLTLVAPSLWLANEAKKSGAFLNNRILHIPYGLDKEVFTLRNKEFSREILNIPKGKKVILFVAESLKNNRKGFVYLMKAFESLNVNDAVLCAVGHKTSELKTMGNLIQLGPIKDERLMSLVYSAADIFIIPSLMDNLPNTVLESLMCGTPVIGFPVGGIKEMIDHGHNGLLTNEISVLALQAAIQSFLNGDYKFNQSEIRNQAIKKYSLEVQAKKYKELFQGLLIDNKC
ncbi:glycosyltransferase [Mangrovimonas sp. YM274]|uniref:glycosyltransferase n=1 Tax=Mangrovimonas sp. YM274 TaxID=3070660 RepID=UPI0027DD601C|nr:glycosyltransferase [Mangrovimonas sp. YM274]WMI69838.1 glycosyltransferase [Mangrovimonas sp. YM274]